MGSKAGRVALAAIAAAGLVLMRTTAVAAPVIDQQQPVIDSSVGGAVIGGASEQKLAQVLTVGITGQLTEVQFPVSCSSGSLVVEIQGVVNHVPDGTVLASQTVPAASLPTFFPNPPAFRGVVLVTALPVVAGDRLALVLSSSGECGIFTGPVGDPYPGGDGFFDSRPNPPGVWVPFSEFVGARIDVPFQTLVDSAGVPAVALGGSLTGITPRSVRIICINATTRRLVRFVVANTVSWNCEERGLVINRGDQIKMQVTVTGRGD